MTRYTLNWYNCDGKIITKSRSTGIHQIPYIITIGNNKVKISNGEKELVYRIVIKDGCTMKINKKSISCISEESLILFISGAIQPQSALNTHLYTSVRELFSDN